MTAKKSKLYVGCISGTSVDGLDVALINISGDDAVEIHQAVTEPLPADLREQLLSLGVPGQDDLDMLGWCDSDLGAFIGETIASFLQQQGLKPDQISAIGCHGQTVRHRPPDDQHTHGFSTQIGDPNRIAEITGITTVADFRRRDMAAGGHGAPLIPPFHQVLFGHIDNHLAVLNIGGISNLSILGEPPSGFDTGPGNALMDNWCVTQRGQPFDANGAWGAAGKVDHGLLSNFLEDDYFSLPPPKSTGREYFNLAWLQAHLCNTSTSATDVQATLCELTARCIADALKLWAPSIRTLVVCGGGRLNDALMQRLADHCNARLCRSEDYNVDGDSIEAGLFAWLAHRTITARPGNEPAVTGAAGYRVLGAIYPGVS